MKDLFSFTDVAEVDGCNTHDLIGCDCDGDGTNVDKNGVNDDDDGEPLTLFAKTWLKSTPTLVRI